MDRGGKKKRKESEKGPLLPFQSSVAGKALAHLGEFLIFFQSSASFFLPYICHGNRIFVGGGWTRVRGD